MEMSKHFEFSTSFKFLEMPPSISNAAKKKKKKKRKRKRKKGRKKKRKEKKNKRGGEWGWGGDGRSAQTKPDDLKKIDDKNQL